MVPKNSEIRLACCPDMQTYVASSDTVIPMFCNIGKIQVPEGCRDIPKPAQHEQAEKREQDYADLCPRIIVLHVHTIDA
jgi:hypothetical protein